MRARKSRAWQSCAFRPTSTIGPCLDEMLRLDRCCARVCRLVLIARSELPLGEAPSQSSAGLRRNRKALHTVSLRGTCAVAQVAGNPSEAPCRPWLRQDRRSKADADIAHESPFVRPLPSGWCLPCVLSPRRRMSQDVASLRAGLQHPAACGLPG